jgi:hypothetical protein
MRRIRHGAQQPLVEDWKRSSRGYTDQFWFGGPILELIATLTPNRTYISSRLSRGSTCRRIRYRRFSQPGGLWANPKTLEVVGKKFGVTRERIRQLQNVALDKLRRALRKKETQQAAPVVATAAPFRLPQAKAAYRAANATLHLIVEPEIISSRQF